MLDLTRRNRARYSATMELRRSLTRNRARHSVTVELRRNRKAIIRRCLKEKPKASLVDHLPKLDISARGKECVLLLMTQSCELSWAPVLAWYPDKQLVGVVANRLLPRHFIPMASCSGMLCGFHREAVLSEWPDDRWRLRVAVCHPGTGFRLELPVLTFFNHSNNSPESANTYGQIKLEMRGNQERFSVHVLSTQAGEHTVYTWHSSSKLWTSSTSSGSVKGNLSGELIFRNEMLHAYDIGSQAWTAMPIPDWKELPLPQGFQGYSYRRVDAFRHGDKVMVLGQCAGDQTSRLIVLLELEEGEQGGGASWKPVAWARREQFAQYSTGCPALEAYWPLQGGDLVVMRAAGSSCLVLHRPVALHVQRQSWVELPTSVCHLNLQAVGIYKPQAMPPVHSP